jgi:hypothetical protein
MKFSIDIKNKLFCEALSAERAWHNRVNQANIETDADYLLFVIENKLRATAKELMPEAYAAYAPVYAKEQADAEAARIAKIEDMLKANVAPVGEVSNEVLGSDSAAA